MNNDRIKKIYRTIMLIIVVSLITFVLTSALLYNKLGQSAYTTFNMSGVNTELITKINTIKTILDNKYISNIKEVDLINASIKGYVSGLNDEYTEYFTKEEMEEFSAEIEGDFVGIGIYMFKDTENNSIVVLSPLEGSPAEKAGIKPGDIIKKVDGIEYTGEDFEKISANIKGKEGTKINIEIEREGKILNFEVVREKVELYPIRSNVLEKNVGYIKITAFDTNCAEKFKNSYEKLKKEKISSLIIDLRNNGGGVVKEALKIAEYIVDKNSTMLITKDGEEKETIEKSTKKPIINMPIIVLTNGNTASASEILAAALRENNKAKIVGEKTYGKGVIQELITLADGSGLKVTVEEYYTPNKNKINKIGLTPDTIISLNGENEEDAQLEEAIKILKNK